MGSVRESLLAVGSLLTRTALLARSDIAKRIAEREIPRGAAAVQLVQMQLLLCGEKVKRPGQ
jgi:hypothetical protein